MRQYLGIKTKKLYKLGTHWIKQDDEDEDDEHHSIA